jgi:hypothetical protein
MDVQDATLSSAIEAWGDGRAMTARPESRTMAEEKCILNVCKARGKEYQVVKLVITVGDEGECDCGCGFTSAVLYPEVFIPLSSDLPHA